GFIAQFYELVRAPRLSRILLGTTMFWMCGAVLKINFLNWGMRVLHLPNNVEVAKLGICLGIGVVIGNVLAGQLHRIGDLRATRVYGFMIAVLLGVLASLSSYWMVLPV